MVGGLLDRMQDKQMLELDFKRNGGAASSTMRHFWNCALGRSNSLLFGGNLKGLVFSRDVECLYNMLRFNSRALGQMHIPRKQRQYEFRPCCQLCGAAEVDAEHILFRCPAL